jgi:D-alanyl-D-alanine carboxypeptidase/D-alanyl-D-alanine-endopeptidase (penicillin-binding protein 4)
MKTKLLLLIILSFLTIEAAFSKPIPRRKILKMLKSSEVLNDHFTGFALYDLSKRKMISRLNDDKYFTPASNTKLFTFYAGLKRFINLLGYSRSLLS